VGYVPVLRPLLRPYDPVVALLIPVVPVPVELPTLLEPAAPAAVSPPAPPAPAPCAKATDELIARIEAKAIVVSFMSFFPRGGSPRDGAIESDGPSKWGGVSWGRLLGVVPLGGTAQT
jgi:hypothetical protein